MEVGLKQRLLALMKKPAQNTFEEFGERFREASHKAGKDQYLVPYFIASHPGSGLEEMIELAQFLKKNGYRPRQVQDFIPTPGTPATCMWWTGIEPNAMKHVWVERKMRNKRKQKALMQYWIPENATLVREALREAGRTDLIGRKHNALVPRAEKAKRPRGRPRHGRS